MHAVRIIGEEDELSESFIAGTSAVRRKSDVEKTQEPVYSGETISENGKSLKNSKIQSYMLGVNTTVIKQRFFCVPHS